MQVQGPNYLLGILWVMSRVAAVLGWPSVDAACLLCRNGVIEDPEHFVAGCPSLLQHRVQFRRLLEQGLVQLGAAGRAALDQYDTASPSQALAMLAGRDLRIPCPPSTDSDAHVLQCAKVAFLFDKISKNFLLRCWRARQNVFGKITVVQGQVVHERPTFLLLQDLPSTPFVFDADSRWQWSRWVPRD